ncbi:RNA 2',3'-cyclic phosphodiesterase [bacterium CG17_big_fil_post_rev_8_21_14_2_50_64_8]|nr:MAG: RNA 2',3'-cyclic phosphodiesterase [bacterium CG17_big_fil_post_rev_8_21_14_2_50_64_8]PJA73475.1 MAG: RNA 2',3'-cyclic phosphodiesterase [bacterium CG_4_9_14_3_um_filter_65_15]
MRVFLGVMLPDRVRGELTSRLDAGGPWPQLRRVPAENWHVTLQFLGPWPPDRCKALSAAMLWSTEVPVFDLRIGPPGQFPAHGPLRVLDLQLQDDGGLARLADRIRHTAHEVWPDGPCDRRPFRPHLTLARGARRGPDTGGIPPVLKDLGELPAWSVEGFSLLSSHPVSGGVRYREESFFALRK